eukprot:NODE_147_length_3461_cov_34.118933_g125_i0.p1 GENE.NODE_147_length_3461_cov_34.118933_g125_i0~~NODE_147_length_3461_cov_34.118933_g125_i0.p1  ORF type:complete len:1104 (-),score=343.31 NODE_147_length_3461_cov_34.118933_g125_i0:84-3395(-)
MSYPPQPPKAPPPTALYRSNYSSGPPPPPPPHSAPSYTTQIYGHTPSSTYNYYPHANVSPPSVHAYPPTQRTGYSNFTNPPLPPTPPPVPNRPSGPTYFSVDATTSSTVLPNYADKFDTIPTNYKTPYSPTIAPVASYPYPNQSIPNLPPLPPLPPVPPPPPPYTATPSSYDAPSYHLSNDVGYSSYYSQPLAPFSLQRNSNAEVVGATLACAVASVMAIATSRALKQWYAMRETTSKYQKVIESPPRTKERKLKEKKVDRLHQEDAEAIRKRREEEMLELAEREKANQYRTWQLLEAEKELQRKEEEARKRNREQRRKEWEEKAKEQREREEREEQLRKERKKEEIKQWVRAEEETMHIYDTELRKKKEEEQRKKKELEEAERRKKQIEEDQRRKKQQEYKRQLERGEWKQLIEVEKLKKGREPQRDDYADLDGDLSDLHNKSYLRESKKDRSNKNEDNLLSVDSYGIFIPWGGNKSSDSQSKHSSKTKNNKEEDRNRERENNEETIDMINDDASSIHPESVTWDSPVHDEPENNTKADEQSPLQQHLQQQSQTAETGKTAQQEESAPDKKRWVVKRRVEGLLPEIRKQPLDDISNEPNKENTEKFIAPLPVTLNLTPFAPISSSFSVVDKKSTNDETNLNEGQSNSSESKNPARSQYATKASLAKEAAKTITIVEPQAEPKLNVTIEVNRRDNTPPRRQETPPPPLNERPYDEESGSDSDSGSDSINHEDQRHILDSGSYNQIQQNEQNEQNEQHLGTQVGTEQERNRRKRRRRHEKDKRHKHHHRRSDKERRHKKRRVNEEQNNSNIGQPTLEIPPTPPQPQQEIHQDHKRKRRRRDHDDEHRRRHRHSKVVEQESPPPPPPPPPPVPAALPPFNPIPTPVPPPPREERKHRHRHHKRNHEDSPVTETVVPSQPPPPSDPQPELLPINGDKKRRKREDRHEDKHHRRRKEHRRHRNEEEPEDTINTLDEIQPIVTDLIPFKLQEEPRPPPPEKQRVSKPVVRFAQRPEKAPHSGEVSRDTVYISGIEAQLNERKIHDVFVDHCGPIDEMNMEDASSNNFGWIKFINTKGFEKCLALNGTIIRELGNNPIAVFERIERKRK